MSAELKYNRTGGREQIREMLIRLQNKAHQRIKDLRKEQESESEPEDVMDSARATAELETLAALIARAEEKLRYLDEALARLDADKYGRCLECGAAISIDRLMAVPFASYCLDCQQKRHRPKRSWGEGTTIPPYDHQWTVPEEMEEPAGREYHSSDPEEQLTIRERHQSNLAIRPRAPGRRRNGSVATRDKYRSQSSTWAI